MFDRTLAALATGLALLAGCASPTGPARPIDDRNYQRGAPISEMEAENMRNQINEARWQRDAAIEALRSPNTPPGNRPKLQQAVGELNQRIIFLENRMAAAGRAVR